MNEPRFGELVRRDRGAVQAIDAAKVAGVSRSFWSDVEHNRRVPSRIVASKMCGAVVGNWNEWLIAWARERLDGSFDDLRLAIEAEASRPSPVTGEAELRDWTAWLIEREPGEDVDGPQPEYWAGSTRWGVAVRQDWTIDPFKARHFTTADEAAAVIGLRLGFGKPVQHGFTGHPAPPSEANVAEIAAGLTELGTGGTPAFIRGYNRGFDDAWEQGASRPSPVTGEAELRAALAVGLHALWEHPQSAPGMGDDACPRVAERLAALMPGGSSGGNVHLPTVAAAETLT